MLLGFHLGGGGKLLGLVDADRRSIRNVERIFSGTWAGGFDGSREGCAPVCDCGSRDRERGRQRQPHQYCLR
jgi:hypothetical protein